MPAGRTEFIDGSSAEEPGSARRLGSSRTEELDVPFPLPFPAPRGGRRGPGDGALAESAAAPGCNSSGAICLYPEKHFEGKPEAVGCGSIQSNVARLPGGGSQSQDFRRFSRLGNQVSSIVNGSIALACPSPT